MLLQSLRAICKAAGGPGSIWKYLDAPVRATGVSGRFGCGFRTDLHFADVGGGRSGGGRSRGRCNGCCDSIHWIPCNGGNVES